MPPSKGHQRSVCGSLFRTMPWAAAREVTLTFGEWHLVPHGAWAAAPEVTLNARGASGPAKQWKGCNT